MQKYKQPYFLFSPPRKSPVPLVTFLITPSLADWKIYRDTSPLKDWKCRSVNIVRTLISGPMPAPAMFSKFKHVGSAPPIHSALESNPIIQYFEIGKQVASSGPELVWKIHDAYRKSDGKVSFSPESQQKTNPDSLCTLLIHRSAGDALATHIFLNHTVAFPNGVLISLRLLICSSLCEHIPWKNKQHFLLQAQQKKYTKERRIKHLKKVI